MNSITQVESNIAYLLDAIKNNRVSIRKKVPYQNN